MLKKLIVSNLAVVEKVEAKFAPGLTVITGETGAGKSVLMGALGLVLGERAEPSIVRDGAKEAEIEADFGETVMRRTVTAQGRSRAWVNDESVSVAELKECAQQLVDVHGPTANQKLLEESFQRQALDAFGSVKGAMYAKAWGELTALAAERTALLREDGDEDAREMLRFQVNELDAAELAEEDATLAERHAASAHAEEIIQTANVVTEALGGDRSATEILIALQPRFREMARHFPMANEWASEAEDLTVRLQELSRTMADAVSKMSGSEEDLEELDARLTLVNKLIRKYRVADVTALIELSKEKRARLEAWENRESRLKELETKILAADQAVRAAGAELTKMREAAAEKLAKAVTRELRDLGFLQVKFSVALEALEPEAHGMDRVVYMFEPNPGEAMRPLASIASSGEIARVMLALKVVLTSSGEKRSGISPTLVFDEIDANIGGEVGCAVGEKLRAVAKHHQVIAITHLPQTAVYGERHLVVAKRVVNGRTCAFLTEVLGESRVAEVARMLGGEKLTCVVKKHAEELLRLSR